MLVSNESCLVDKTSYEAVLEAKLFFFPLSCLVLGLILDVVRNHLRLTVFQIPSSVLQLIVACLFSSLAFNFLKGTVMLKKIFDEYGWMEQTPHTIMKITLPILIFESAFRMEAHAFHQQLVPICVLAVVGFLLSAALFGGLMYVLMIMIIHEEASQWVVFCFALGSIVSATDPVAIISLLDELGVPGIMRTLIEGESLLNDGVALIVFLLFEKVLKYQYSNHAQVIMWPETIVMQIVGVVGSIFMGSLIARINMFLLIHAFRDITREIGIIFVSTFSCYWISEAIGGSGILSLVVLGVLINSHQEKLNPKTVEQLNNLYEFLTDFANSIIFTYSGIVVGEVFYYVSDQLPMDIGASLIVYLISLVSRGVVVMLIGSAFRLIQHKKNKPLLSWPEIFMIFWGGLRGAVALLLAVQLNELEQIPKLMRYRVLVYVSVTVFLSLVLQAASYRPLINFFELTKRSTFKGKRLQQRLEDLYCDSALKHFNHLQTDPSYYYLSSASWSTVWSLVQKALHPHDILASPPNDANHPNIDSHSMSSSVTIVNEDKYTTVLQSYLNLLKSRVWHMWKLGLFSRKTVTLLVHSLDSALDKLMPVDIPAVLKIKSTHAFADKVADFVEVNGMQARNYPRSHDWWRLFSFLILLVQFIITFVMFLNHEESPRILMTIIFLISLFFVVEQLCLIRQHYAGIFKVSLWVRIEICVDLIFLLYYVTVLVMGAVALKTSSHENVALLEGQISKCLLISECDTNWVENGQFCKVFMWYIYCGISSRFILKIPFAMWNLVKLVVAEVYQSVKLSEAHRIAFLNALMRITEDVKYGFLARVVPGQDLLLIASQHNRSLRNHAEKALVKILKTRKTPNSYRWVQTMQASRILLVSIKEKLKELESDGGLTLDEFEELSGRLENALTSVNSLRMSDIPEPKVQHQLRRVGWIQRPGSDLTPEVVIDYMLNEGGLMRIGNDSGGDIISQGYIFFREGSAIDGMYFLNDGLCAAYQEAPGRKSTRRYIYPGSWFGDQVILIGYKSSRRRKTTVKAITDCSVYKLSLEDVKNLLQFAPGITDEIALTFGLRICKEYIRRFRPYNTYSDVQLDDFVRSPSNLFHCQKRQNQFSIPNGQCAIVFQGEVTEVASGQTTVIVPGDPVVKVCHGEVIVKCNKTAGSSSYLLIINDLNGAHFSPCDSPVSQIVEDSEID